MEGDGEGLLVLARKHLGDSVLEAVLHLDVDLVAWLAEVPIGVVLALASKLLAEKEKYRGSTFFFNTIRKKNFFKG